MKWSLAVGACGATVHALVLKESKGGGMPDQMKALAQLAPDHRNMSAW